MSSFLPDVLVADAMKKLGVKSNIDPATLNKQVQAGLDRLYHYQHPDGGWGWWQTDDSHPLHDRLCACRPDPGQGSRLRREAGCIDKGRSVAAARVQQARTKVRTDLRAYMAYALVAQRTQTRTQPSSIPSGASAPRSPPTDRPCWGLAMLQVNDARANDLAKQLEGEAKQDDTQAWWPTDYNYLMDFYGDTTPQATAYALKLLDHVDAASPLSAQGRALPGQSSQPGLLLGFDRADRDGHLRSHRLSCNARRS